MSAARQIVRESGTIIMVAACQDGLPDHGRYAELLQMGGSPQGVLDLIQQSAKVCRLSKLNKPFSSLVKKSKPS